MGARSEYFGGQADSNSRMAQLGIAGRCARRLQSSAVWRRSCHQRDFAEFRPADPQQRANERAAADSTIGPASILTSCNDQARTNYFASPGAAPNARLPPARGLSLSL